MKTGISVPPEFLDAMKGRASELDLDISKYIRKLVREDLQRNGKKVVDYAVEEAVNSSKAQAAARRQPRTRTPEPPSEG